MRTHESDHGTASDVPCPATRWLQRPGGRLAFDLNGEGPLIVCAPGMGDVRESFRHVVADLAAAGFRVASLDLRGHGDSDTTFDAHDDEALADDLLALVEHLGGPALLVGNSMAAGAAVIAAARQPDAVAGLALLGPFVRDVPVGLVARVALRVALTRPWGPALWPAFVRRLHVGARPDDLDEHLARIRRSLARPGAWRSFVATTRTSHATAEARLDEVAAPTLVVMGTADPDFADPAAEARLAADRLQGRVLLVDRAGHYPHAQRPEVVVPALRAFADEALRRA